MSTGVLEPQVAVTRRVVVIDDDPGRAGLDRYDLEKLGAEQVIFGSIAAAERSFAGIAREVAAETVIILDLMFPDTPEPGLECLRKIRAGEYPIPMGTPVVVYSAHDESEVEAEVRKQRATLVVKGGNPHRLMSAVSKAFSGEVMVASVECHVESVEPDEPQILIRIDGHDGWYAKRWLQREFIPSVAQIVGGMFYIQTFRRYSATLPERVEYVVRSVGVDAEDEARELDEMFEGIDADSDRI